MLRNALNALLDVPQVAPQDFFARLPVLETDRLLLRPLKMRDANDIFCYGSDPKVSLHCLWEPYAGIEDARAYLRYMRQQYRLGLPSSYGVVLKETGHIIGTIGFMTYQPDHSCAEIGYSYSSAAWGKGYATEALAALLKLAFEQMKLHRVEAMHEVDNPASGRVMEKNGMQLEGVMRGKIMNRGKYRDVSLWSILAEDWKREHP